MCDITRQKDKDVETTESQILWQSYKSITRYLQGKYYFISFFSLFLS